MWCVSPWHAQKSRTKQPAGASSAVEWTTDLFGEGLWSTEGVTDVLVTDFGPYETRRATVPMSAGEAKKFLRLRVSQP